MITLVPAVEADFPQVVALSNLAYRGEGAAPGWTHESYLAGPRISAGMLRDDLASQPDARLLLWRDEAGDLLGHVWLEPAEPGVWYLGLLTVRPDRQDQKLGRSLLGAAEDFARRLGAARIRMTVINVRDTLIAWYQRRGYALTGEVRPFPYGDDKFGTPQRSDLSFVVLEKAL